MVIMFDLAADTLLSILVHLFHQSISLIILAVSMLFLAPGLLLLAFFSSLRTSSCYRTAPAALGGMPVLLNTQLRRQG